MESKTEFVLLVNEHDEVVGEMEKLEAHQKGLLHRAFSILIYNGKGELLLQQRSLNKYHSAGLWTNTCCSHPCKNESVLEAGNRRLKEEMGFSCTLHHSFHFIYQTPLDSGLIEHELDHVLFGIYSGNIEPNPQEVMAYKWMSMNDIEQAISATPEQFTVWFQLLFTSHLLSLKKYIHENLSYRAI